MENVCKLLPENSVDVLSSLIANGANVNSDNKRGWSPLLIVSSSFDDTKDKYKITKLLLDNKADINSCEPVHLTTPLMLFAKRHNYNMMNFLLENRADVTRTDVFGSTFLNYVKNKQEAKKLISCGYPYKKTDFLLDIENEVLCEKIEMLKCFISDKTNR